MNSDISFLQQQDRQHQIIDVLLTENAYLKQALAALLPGGNGLPQTELAFLKVMISNNAIENSNQKAMPGNNGLINSNNQVLVGNKESNIPFYHPIAGNNGVNNSNHQPQEGINEQQLAVVQANVRVLMKRAILRSHLATSKILVQLNSNPATPLPDLRQLTGLTEDGMAKRIMAMKKAGLITRVPAPKRYLLTEKAKALFVENRR